MEYTWGVQPLLPSLTVAAGMGAIWGSFGYSILWDGRPFAVTRRFVVSSHGTLVLLPVRIVLFAIHFVERHIAGHPFAFENDSWWIGVAAAGVGVILTAAGWLVVRSLWHAVQVGRRRLRPASGSEPTSGGRRPDTASTSGTSGASAGAARTGTPNARAAPD
jgi:hypothetical protein